MHFGVETAVLFIVLLGVYSGSSHAVLLGFAQPGPIEISESNNLFATSIVISGLGDGPSGTTLGGYDLDISYDPNILSFLGANFTGALDEGVFGSVTESSSTSGTANLFELSLEDPTLLNNNQEDTLFLATLIFEIMDIGQVVLDITANSVVDAFANPLALDPLVNTPLVVNIVPEPGGAPILATALLLLYARQRR